MKDHRDIYKKPDSQKDRGPLPSYEPSPGELWARTRRNLLMGIGIMVGLLVITLVIFSVQQGNRDRDELEEVLTNLVSRSSVRTLPETDIGYPQVEFTREDAARIRAEAETIAPQKIAEAMGHIRIAFDYLREREWDQAEEQVRKALDIWPDMITAQRLLGSIYTQRGQFDQAILILENAIKRDPFNVESFNNLAINYLQKDMLPRAEELFLTALNIRPDSSATHLNLGLLYLRWGRYDQAAEHYEEARRGMPNQPALLNNLSVCYIRAGQYDEARELLSALVERAPERPSGYFNMAITYALEGRFDDVYEWLARGAEQCTPNQLYSYLSDSDFDAIRNEPKFQEFMNRVFPEVPVLPVGGAP
ncbi:MAG: tetratricopeptide repeat protein [Verrucomicrobia bacterium]|nr:tetratricopeptide repeat protein [Verrucomicrobiota bacterium]